jgi:hypothetical protein
MLRPSSVARPLPTLLVASVLVLLLWLPHTCIAAPNASQSKSSAAIPPSAPQPMLPETFAGWQISGTPQQSTNPRAADDGDGAALQEYGFTQYEMADYTRDSDNLTLKAMQFGDATGAFGAFTLYRRPNMAPEQIGQGGAFDGTRVLFWSGTVLVDAKFSRLTGMSLSELRDLATQLPQPMGNRSVLPTLPAYLPQPHLEASTVQYAIGPQAYLLGGGVLPSALVGFDRSAEVVTAQYNALNGTGTLTIINYPTSEIAIDRERAIQGYFASRGKGQYPWTPTLADSNPAAIQSRRSGPLVAVVSGSFSADAAQQLSQRVHYEVNMTMGNRSKYVPDTAKVAQIILGVAALVGIFAVIAIVAGISLGGGRVLWRKLRAKPGSTQEDPAEFIRLNLKD